MGRPFVDVANGITETITYDPGERQVVVRRSEDITPVIDAVAKANLEGVRDIDGLGRLVLEVPVTVAMQFCDERGIAWERFLYGNEYDAEFKRFARDHAKLAYEHKKRFH